LWRTFVFSAPIQHEQKELVLAAQEKKELEFVLDMPAASRRVTLDWRILVMAETGEEKHSRRNFDVFPAEPQERFRHLLTNKKVGLYDPKGETEKLLQHLNAECSSLKRRAELKNFNGTLLIVGNTAVTDQDKAIYSILRDKVTEGLSILFLEQDFLPDQFVLPLAFSSEKSRRARGLAHGHPLFDNLREGDLENWRGDGVIARSLLEKPQNGNFLVLVDEPPTANGRDSRGALVLEIPHGKGRMLFSQVLLIEKYDSEPVAGILLENIIRYGLTSRDPYKNVALFGREQNHLFNFIKELGTTTIENPANIIDFQIIIITPREDFESSMRRITPDFFAGIHHFIQRGGCLMIFDMQPQMYNRLRGIFPQEIGFQMKAPQFPLLFKRDDPIFWGIAEEDLLQCHFSTTSLSFAHTPESRELIRPGKMSIFRTGKGKIIVCQLDFAEENTKEATMRVVSQLLTNVGIPIQAHQSEKGDK
jgi:hypothetical protein